MRLLLDENAPRSLLRVLHQLGHYAAHVEHRGLKGSSDKVVLAYALAEDFTLLSLNKFKRGPDRLDALEAMTKGARIVRVTAKGLRRQESAVEQLIAEVEASFERDSALRRATIMNNLQVRYDTLSDIERMLEGGDSEIGTL